ncbi:MAG: amino acid ABC transporter substrate-binding protein, partial [Actinobacteria bacterium]|nr:amino acid ABC transporter substrate-binding protein [Actinomycetota bacterium]
PGQLVVGFGDPAVNFANGKIRGSSYLTPKGYEVDLATAIAAGLGVKPTFVYTPWAKLFAAGHKSFDISFQEATITAQRRRTIDFTHSYFDANQGVLLSKKAKVPKSLSDLKNLQTCAQADTTGLSYIQQKLHPAKAPLIYQSTAAAFVAVQIGRCDAIVLDTPIVASEKKARPTKYGNVAGQIITHEQYGAVLQKGSKLTSMVNAQVDKLWKNGTIGKLQKKWFNLDFSKIPNLK